jgi:GntR family transcriptional regulator
MTGHGRLRADQRPLYVQASEALISLLRNGDFHAGDRLPTEIALSQRLGISRPTLREALRILEDEEIIWRRQGAGTFLLDTPPVIDSGLEVLESVLRQAERCGFSTDVYELSVEVRPASEPELTRLQAPAAALVTEVKRVIAVGAGQRAAYLVDIVPQEYLEPEQLGPDFRGSVLDLLLSRGRPAPAYSLTEPTAEGASAELAAKLHVRGGTVLQKLEAQLFATDGRVIDYSISYFVPGHFRFHVVRRVG